MIRIISGIRSDDVCLIIALDENTVSWFDLLLLWTNNT